MKYKPQIVLAYFKECKLPECVTESKFHPTRRWLFDFAFRKEKVAIEVQGGIWTGGAHARPVFLMRDYEKLNEAQCLGWVVLQVQPKEICTMELVELVRRAIKRQECKLC